MRGLFITGTSTGVGKTAIASGLAWALRRRKINVGIMKPFATANKASSKKFKSMDTANLARAAGIHDSDNTLNPFFYSIAASPFVASQLRHEPLASVDKAIQILQGLAKKHEFMIVEGIGGILVPITENEYIADFAKRADLATIIVTTPVIGTINHTLLTVMACRKFDISIKGIIVNMMPKRPNIAEQKASETIQMLAGVNVITTLPILRSANHVAVGKLFEKMQLIDELVSMQ